MQRGKVKRWDDAKGYGFLQPSNGGKDIFCHHTGIDGVGRRSLTEGEEVEFNVVQGQKGPQAENVRVALNQPSFKKNR